MKSNYFNSLELTNIVILVVVALIIFELRRDILEKLQCFVHKMVTKNEKQIVHNLATNKTISHSANATNNKSSLLKTVPYLLLFSDLLVLVLTFFTSIIGAILSILIFVYLGYKYQNEYYNKVCLSSEWENRNVKKVKTNLIIGSIISFLFLFIYLIMLICEPLLDFSINLLGNNEVISYFIFIIASKLIGLFVLNKTIFSFGKIKNKIDNGILIFKCILYAIYFFAIQYVCLIVVMLMHVHFPT